MKVIFSYISYGRSEMIPNLRVLFKSKDTSYSCGEFDDFQGLETPYDSRHCNQHR